MILSGLCRFQPESKREKKTCSTKGVRRLEADHLLGLLIGVCGFILFGGENGMLLKSSQVKWSRDARILLRHGGNTYLFLFFTPSSIRNMKGS